MLYKKREMFSKISYKTGKYFYRLNRNPNLWTLMSILTSFISAFFILKNNFFAASIFLFITIVLDFIDGSVARFGKKVTKKGAYLDTITDRYTEGIVIISLFFAPISDFIFPVKFLLIVYLFGSFMTTYAKSSAAEKKIGEICGGLLERAERVCLLFVGLVLAQVSYSYLSFIIFLLAILSNITALQRIFTAINHA